jgi:hypothetical protein
MHPGSKKNQKKKVLVDSHNHQQRYCMLIRAHTATARHANPIGPEQLARAPSMGTQQNGKASGKSKTGHPGSVLKPALQRRATTMLVVFERGKREKGVGSLRYVQPAVLCAKKKDSVRHNPPPTIALLLS